MAIQSLTDLKALINSTIQDNTTNDISGSDVQTALINAIDTLDSLEGFINVHKANGQTTITAYGSKALARAAVPDDCKKEGVVIAYKISTGWLIEQNLDATAGTWGDDTSWQTIGPVSVSQNISTGGFDLTIGSDSKNIASQAQLNGLNKPLTPTDSGDGYALDKMGVIYTNQYISGCCVLSYDISDQSILTIHTKTPAFHNGKNIMIGGLYKSDDLVFSFGVMESNNDINKLYDFLLFNNYYGADTLKLSVNTSYKDSVLVGSSPFVRRLKTEKVSEKYIQPSNIQYKACVINDGTIKTQYVDDTNVLTFSIADTKSVNVEFKSYTYSSPCVIGALYKNGSFIKHLGAMSVEQCKRINILNDGQYDTLKLSVLNTEMWNTMVTTSPIDDESYAKIDTVNSQISDLKSDISDMISDVPQVTLLPVELVNDEKINATTLSIGDTYSSVANSWRGLYKIDVVGKNGYIKINNVIYSGGCEVVVCDSNNIVLDIFPANNANSRASIVGVNLKKYTDATTIYIDGKPNGATAYSDITAEYTNYSIIKDSTRKTNAATILLHFDGVDYDLSKFISERKGICAEYGIKKGSFCVSPSSFNASLTDWVSTTIKNEYFAAIADGWDCALYPNRASADYDEENWDDWFDDILPKIEALGVCNITTLAAGQLFVNDGLLASAKKHGFKVIRGGAGIMSGSIVYTFDDAYTPQELSDRDCYIFDTITNISTKQTTDNLGELKNHIDYCVQSKSAISVIAHSIVPDNETSSTDDTNCGITNFQTILAYIKNYIDAGVLRVMSWREWYAMMNPADGGTNDYCRLIKMRNIV